MGAGARLPVARGDVSRSRYTAGTRRLCGGRRSTGVRGARDIELNAQKPPPLGVPQRMMRPATLATRGITPSPTPRTAPPARCRACTCDTTWHEASKVKLRAITPNIGRDSGGVRAPSAIMTEEEDHVAFRKSPAVQRCYHACSIPMYFFVMKQHHTHTPTASSTAPRVYIRCHGHLSACYACHEPLHLHT